MLEKELGKMTKQQLIEYIASLGQTVQNAESQHQVAVTSAKNAENQHQVAVTSAQNAENQHQVAVTSAQNAENQHQEAATSAQNAESQHQEAVTSAQNAEKQRQAASSSAKIAKGQQQAAATSAKNAAKSEGEASASMETVKGMVADIELPDTGHKATILGTLDAISEVQVTINNLLPGVAATGLAHAFYASKLRYGNDPIGESNSGKEDTLENQEKAVQIKSIHQRNNLVNIGLYTLFVLALMSIVGVVVLTIAWKDIANALGTEPSFWSLLIRASLVSPLIWLAIHVNRTINRRFNLYEEYNYRQRLMELYVGFQKQSPDTDEGKQNLALLTKIIFENIMVPPGKKDLHGSDSPFESLLGRFLPFNNTLKNEAKPQTEMFEK